MKKFKSGFTLAEVLITLGIIGVVAAIVMPSVMTNYTYKTVGVKLSKFVSQLEGSTRPYVVQNTIFSDAATAQDYIVESFLIRNLDDLKDDATGSLVSVVKDLTLNATNKEFDAFNKTSNPIVQIKDGTEFRAYMLDTNYDEDDEINTAQVGEAIWGIAFAPKVNGLPKAVQKSYKFVITELGYVYPDRSVDNCMAGIWDAEFMTTSKTFKEGSACVPTGEE